MKLEDQVCTLEQAKSLKELGISQESMFSYINQNQSAWPVVMIYYKGQIHDIMTEFGDKSPFSINVIASAFTLAELGVMLSNGFQVDRSTFNKTKGKFYVYGTVNDFDYYDTEAQARAAKLIDALERELITVDEVNQRLIK